MKADVVSLKQLPAGVGQKMLAQMLLHSVQTHRPVQHSLCLGANLQRFVALMVNVTILSLTWLTTASASLPLSLS